MRPRTLKYLDGAHTNGIPAWYPWDEVREARASLQPREIVVVTEPSSVAAAPTVVKRSIDDIPPPARAVYPDLHVGDTLLIFNGGRALVIRVEKN